jgi:hypothetical protein
MDFADVACELTATTTGRSYIHVASTLLPIEPSNA